MNPSDNNRTNLAPLATGIQVVRGCVVMRDSDLAEVYGVETRRVNESVKRNPERFEYPYSFQLLKNEWDVLRSQFATSKPGRGGRRYPPRVFTEHGAVMLATVLNSSQAIQASKMIIDTFVRFRHVMDANIAFARKLDELSAKVGKHDRAFVAVFEELKRLAENMEPELPRERIGFKPNKKQIMSVKTQA